MSDTTVDFSTLLNRPTDEITKPKALPAGTFYGRLDRYEVGASRQKKTPYVRYSIKVQSAGEDVDADALSACGDITRKTLNKDFFLTPDSQWRVMEFIQSCSYDTAGKTLGSTLPLPVGSLVRFKVTQRVNGDDIFNDVGDITGNTSD